jgi:hypothetical protein
MLYKMQTATFTRLAKVQLIGNTVTKSSPRKG